ncbi:TetR/AcrR family transcriptional regulator [Paraburkholderia bannensis]|uniref:TetR/AcrR family transcriptional regulator n=1 Tax=Paraburkholderia bannensis TaxID=765414 RepID=UPI0005A7FE72|nr:TetR/AcrR family transcriptional regulator [Paraburkholderia bannensis]
MQKNAKRQSIVETATQLFAQHGYHAVGTDRIIDESGVAKMTLFRNFPTKNDLISEVLSQRAQSALSSLASMVASKRTALERIEAVFEWHEQWFTSRDFSGCMFTGALAEFQSESSEITRIATVQKANLRLFIQNLLLDLVPAPSIALLARQIVMLLDGATMSAVAGDHENAAHEAHAAAMSLILSLQAPPAAAAKASRARSEQKKTS